MIETIDLFWLVVLAAFLAWIFNGYGDNDGDNFCC